MNYATLENAIATRLQEHTPLSGVCDVAVLPDSVAEYKTPVIKGLATVAFVGEKYDRNQSIGEPSQHTTLTFTVSVQSRTLRESTGVYAIAELVKSRLQGFHLENCGPLVLNEHRFTDYQNDVWEHSIVFTCRSLRAASAVSWLSSDNVTSGEEVIFDRVTIKENEV